MFSCGVAPDAPSLDGLATNRPERIWIPVSDYAAMGSSMRFKPGKMSADSLRNKAVLVKRWVCNL